MKFELDKVIPWGRSYGEYVKMFSLDDDDLNQKILSVADGPASFNSELTAKGGNVTSVDPLYQFTSKQIQARINEIYEKVLKETQNNKEKFVWKFIHSVEDLGNIRMKAMNKFLLDFEKGKEEKRYICGEIPNISFKNDQFDLCLCSHFLFLYTDHLSLNFHKQSIAEMIRVSKEVRIFPLLTLNGDKSKYLEEVMDDIVANGYYAVKEKVDYEFQLVGNEMLKIGRAC